MRRKGRTWKRNGEGTPLDGHENRRHTARLWHLRHGKRGRGQREIGELAALFEKCFHVELGNVYHAFGRLRGQQNPTAFLDEMKEKLLKKMRDMDSK